MHRIIAPLAFLIVPGIALAQRGEHGRGAQHPERAAAPVTHTMPAQVPEQVPEHPRPTQRVLKHRSQSVLSNGDVTRSDRADDRANDVTARTTHKRKHHKKSKPSY